MATDSLPFAHSNSRALFYVSTDSLSFAYLDSRAPSHITMVTLESFRMDVCFAVLFYVFLLCSLHAETLSCPLPTWTDEHSLWDITEDPEEVGN